MRARQPLQQQPRAADAGPGQSGRRRGTELGTRVQTEQPEQPGGRLGQRSVRPSLRLRAGCGERIRVVGPDAISSLERTGPLPELLTIGGRTLYRIRYDQQGVLTGPVRYLDPGLVARCEEVMGDLYAAVEDMRDLPDRSGLRAMCDRTGVVRLSGAFAEAARTGPFSR